MVDCCSHTNATHALKALPSQHRIRFLCKINASQNMLNKVMEALNQGQLDFDTHGNLQKTAHTSQTVAPCGPAMVPCWEAARAESVSHICPLGIHFKGSLTPKNWLNHGRGRRGFPTGKSYSKTLSFHDREGSFHVLANAWLGSALLGPQKGGLPREVRSEAVAAPQWSTSPPA